MNFFTYCMGQNYEIPSAILEKEGCEAEIRTEPMFLDLELSSSVSYKLAE